MASVSDNFNRADETPIASPWIAVENSLRLIEEAVFGNAAGARGCARYGGAGLGSDHETQVTIITPSNSAPDDRHLGPCVRCQSGAASYYFFASDSVQSKLWKVVSGTPTALATGGTAFAADDVVRVSAVGTTLTGYINDVQELQVTDSDLSGGDPGVFIHDAANQKLDDFFAQDVAAGGGPTPRAIIAMRKAAA